MTAFGFRFGKKRPDSSAPPAKDQLKNIKTQSASTEPMAEKMKEIIKDKPKRHKKSQPFRLLFNLLVLVVLAAASLVIFGPKYAPEFMDKIGATKLMKSLPFIKQEPEELFITPEEQAIEELATVRAYRVVRGDFVDVLPGMGTIRGDREVELRFTTNGMRY